MEHPIVPATHFGMVYKVDQQSNNLLYQDQLTSYEQFDSILERECVDTSIVIRKARRNRARIIFEIFY
jgi:hypothetical protein